MFGYVYVFVSSLVSVTLLLSCEKFREQRLPLIFKLVTMRLIRRKGSPMLFELLINSIFLFGYLWGR